MAGTDFIVHLQARDNLKQTLKNVNDELKKMGVEQSNIDALKAKFERITNSTAPLKKQLKDIQSVMAEMSLAGLDNTSVFSDAAEYAGQLRDAMSDAAQSVRNFASDTQALDTVKGAFQGLSAIVSMSTNIMTGFGLEESKAQQITAATARNIQMLAAAQQLSNTFNKNGAVVTSLNAAATRLMGTSAKSAAAGNAVLSASAKGLSLSIRGVGIAIKSLPAIGWALAAISAITDAIGLFSDSNEDAETALDGTSTAYNEAIKKSIEYKNGIDNDIEAIKNFNGNARQEQKMLDDLNTKYGEQIGYCSSLEEMKRKLIEKSPAMVQATMLEAQAQAAATKAVEAYIRGLELKRRYESGDQNEVYWFNVFSSEADWYAKAKAEADAEYKYWEKEQKRLMAEAAKVSEAYDLGGYKKPDSNDGKKGGNGKSGTAKHEKKTVEEIKGYYADLEKEKQKLEKILKAKGDKYAGFEADRARLDQINQELKVRDEQINAAENARKAEEKAAEAAQKAEEARTKALGELQKKTDVSQYKAAEEKGPELGARASLVQDMIDANNQQIESIQELIDKYKELKGEGTEDYQALIAKSAELKTANEANATMLQKAKEADNLYKNMGDAASAVTSLGSAFSSLGQLTDEPALNIAGMVAQAVGNMMLSYSQMMANPATASLGPWGWVAFAAAGLAQTLGIIAQIKSATAGYADGGLVKSNSFHGDNNLVRVNGGEMILNGKQQSNLFNLLDGNRVDSGTSNVHFKIKGSDLYGTLKNYKNMNKSTMNFNI